MKKNNISTYADYEKYLEQENRKRKAVKKNEDELIEEAYKNSLEFKNFVEKLN